MKEIDIARARINELYSNRLKARGQASPGSQSASAKSRAVPVAAGGLFKLEEVDVESMPALIQCCIR